VEPNSKVSPHWTPVQNGVATPPEKYSLQGGSKGGDCDLRGAPPWRGVSREVPSKLRIDVNLPCKNIEISSQSGLFISQRSDDRSYV